MPSVTFARDLTKVVVVAHRVVELKWEWGGPNSKSYDQHIDISPLNPEIDKA